MPIVKHSRNEVLKIQEFISRNRMHRERLKLIQRGRETEFWKALKENLCLISKECGDKINGELGKREDLNREMLRFWYGQKLMADAVISQVEETDAHINEVNAIIEKAEDKIKNIEEEVEE